MEGCGKVFREVRLGSVARGENALGRDAEIQHEIGWQVRMRLAATRLVDHRVDGGCSEVGVIRGGVDIRRLMRRWKYADRAVIIADLALAGQGGSRRSRVSVSRYLIC